MSSILTHSRLPLWVYIVIIAIGSVLLLSFLLIIWRWCHVRKAAQNGFRYENSQTPTRRVTIRRGRVVPTDHYLSLTGSKFGVRQFNNLEDGTDKDRSRSKSPFEWWTTIMDRSQSRQSEMTQAGPSRLGNHMYTPDMLEAGPHPSPPVSAGLIRTQAKSETSHGDLPKKPSPSAQPPSRHTNFSRSFVARGQTSASSTSTIRQQRSVEQVSPHLASDNISSKSEKACSSISVHEFPGPQSPNLDIPSDQTHSFLYSPSASFLALTHTKTPSTTTPSQPSLRRQPSKPYSESTLHHETSGSRRSHTSSYHHRSSSIREEGYTATLANTVQTSKSANELDIHPSKPSEFEGDRGSPYWSTRPDLRPVRKPSKKGNVLRKKSLRRAEVVSWVGS